MRATAASVVIFLSMTCSAAAGDGRTQDWHGFYIGGHVGASWGETGNSWRNNVTPWTPDGDISYDNVSSGLHLGHLWQQDWLAVGIEGDVTWASLKGDDSQFAGLVNAIEMNTVGTIRARAGVVQGPSLFYATGGIAFGDLEKKDLTLGASASNDLVGWTIGGGYEHAFIGGWRGRIEYQYVDFGSAVSGLSYDHRADDLDIQSLRAGVSYGF
ncbi:MAG: outer membrane protein [Hyphomicrobium sp.]|uniref:outer membrane protein n=1 Tax=Hyphomicrobium sp. TaxID=82 RepID=UPI003D129A46